MGTQWGRRETVIWPPHVAIYTLAAFAMAGFLTLILMWMTFRFGFAPLQQSYTVDYVRAAIGAQFRQQGNYQLWYVAGVAKRPRLAVKDDLIERTPNLMSASDVSSHAGYDVHFRGRPSRYVDASLYRWMRYAIFDGKTIVELYRWPLFEGAALLMAFLVASSWLDVVRLKQMKYGRLLRGPEMVTPRAFKRKVKGKGVGFEVKPRLRIPFLRPLMIRIPRDQEAKSFQFIGDTGTGKSQLITQLCCQVRKRGESAIIYDPSGKFIEHFYDEGRGDVILNPLDVRCPHWGPAMEMRRNTEAHAIAESLYQPSAESASGKDEFFHKTPAQIFAHLLKEGPTPHQLAAWMADENEIEQRVKDTEMALYIKRGAAPQRTGVLSSLGLVAGSLRLLPTAEQTKGRTWSATSWAEERKGWIFITSSESERKILLPLHSLWIDLLVMRLMLRPQQPRQRKVWFIIDELASLQRLPQLHTAITENRKSGNVIVLGFQGKAQLETIYGHLAEVMLSQPATKVFMRTTAPTAAKWISEALGDVEIERLKETKFDGRRSGKNFTLDRQTEPLVMASEMEGLPDRHAYLKFNNYVTRFTFDVTKLPGLSEGFIARNIPEDELIFDPITMLPKPGRRPPPVAPPGIENLPPLPGDEAPQQEASDMPLPPSEEEPAVAAATPPAIEQAEEQQQEPQVRSEQQQAKEELEEQVSLHTMTHGF